MIIRISTIGFAGIFTAAGLTIFAAQEDSSVPAPDFDTNSEPKVLQPAQINLSPGLAEVVRLAESGAEESVILAYISKAPAYQVSSDEIIYLRDLGISEPVLKALIDHSQPGSVAAPSAPVPTNPPPAVATAPLTPPADVQEFYQPLEPYGSWVEVAPYGWCWQPTVAVVYRGWQPYCDNGYWLWSDSGWYWHSYYSWGWAPFHYGRWFHHPHRGWIWAPDRVWGPSWVLWRDSPGYCGWAPLPPGAYFSASVGWTFHGHAVGPSFGFGIGATHFAFVSTAHFADRHVAAQRLPPREVNVVFNKTTVINNYSVGSGNRFISRGVDRGAIEAASGTRLRQVTVKEIPSNRTAMPDRVTSQGNAEVVYRPGPKIDLPRQPAPALGLRARPINRQEIQPHAESVPRQTPTRPVQPTPGPIENQPPPSAINPAPTREPAPTVTRPAPTTPVPSTPAPAPIRPGTIPHSAQPTPATPSPPPAEATPSPAKPAPNRPATVPPREHEATREQLPRPVQPVQPAPVSPAQPSPRPVQPSPPPRENQPRAAVISRERLRAPASDRASEPSPQPMLPSVTARSIPTRPHANAPPLQPRSLPPASEPRVRLPSQMSPFRPRVPTSPPQNVRRSEIKPRRNHDGVVAVCSNLRILNGTIKGFPAAQVRPEIVTREGDSRAEADNSVS